MFTKGSGSRASATYGSSTAQSSRVSQHSPGGHSEAGHANVPMNKKLWDMLVMQAKTKFVKWPSLPASKWVHSEYVKKGGQFTTEKERTEQMSKSAHGRRELEDEREKKKDEKDTHGKQWQQFHRTVKKD
jgi:hypothetical protein